MRLNFLKNICWSYALLFQLVFRFQNLHKILMRKRKWVSKSKRKGTDLSWCHCLFLEIKRQKRALRKERLYWYAISQRRTFPSCLKLFASSKFVGSTLLVLTFRYMRLSAEKLEKWESDPEEFLIDQMNETHTLKYASRQSMFLYWLLVYILLQNISSCCSFDTRRKID